MKLVRNEAGILQLIVVLIILASLAVGVYLVQTRTNLLPKAYDNLSDPISTPVSPTPTPTISPSLTPTPSPKIKPTQKPKPVKSPKGNSR